MIATFRCPSTSRRGAGMVPGSREPSGYFQVMLRQMRAQRSGNYGDRQGRYGNGFASQKCGGAKVTIRSLLLCGDRDIDIHRLRDWHGLPIASGPQALKLVKRFVETSLKSGFVTGELTKCIALFRTSVQGRLLPGRVHIGRDLSVLSPPRARFCL